MKTSQTFRLFQEVLICTILFVGVAGCSPIVRVPEPSESVPLQSVEEYERSEAMKVLEQVDVGDDPILANMLEVAKAELTDEDKSLALAEGDNGLEIPGGLFVAPGAAGVASEGDGSIIVEQIVTNLLTIDLPAVGALLYDPLGTGYFQTACTATLIGCDTVLTAAHCLKDKPQPQQLKYYSPNAGLFNVIDYLKHPDFTVIPNADLALLRLEKAVDGVRPESINSAQNVESGSQGMIVGFGYTGGTKLDFGLKRYGKVTTSSCNSSFSNDNLICWKLLAGGETTCRGDSGGPFFYPFVGGRQISGVTSGGSINCAANSSSTVDVRVSRYADWIRANSWSLETERCGQLPLVENDVTATFHGSGGDLSKVKPQARHDFDVAPGTRLLRITLNGEDPQPWQNDFNLYVTTRAVTSNGTENRNKDATTPLWLIRRTCCDGARLACRRPLLHRIVQRSEEWSGDSCDRAVYGWW